MVITVTTCRFQNLPFTFVDDDVIKILDLVVNILVPIAFTCSDHSIPEELGKPLSNMIIWSGSFETVSSKIPVY